MSRYVLAIDQGTTGTTVLLVDEGLRVASRGYAEFAQIYPQPGWVEHDLEAIWNSVLAALGAALAAAPKNGAEIAAIGITNQRETTVCIDEAGRALHHAIVWQDRRTADLCAQLRAASHEPMVRARTGLLLDPYFSGTKMAWLLSHVPALPARAAAGRARLGTIDSFLIHRLSGGAAWVTDGSNASRTLLFDLHKLDWDDELLALFGVPRAALPTIVPSQGICAETRGVPGLRDGIPIAGIAGDQQAALFGQLCHRAGEAKCTYGTGAFLLMNTGDRAVPSQHGLVSTLGWQRPRASGLRTQYALEGSAFIAGAMVQWLRDGLGIIGSAAEIEALARSVPDSGGVIVVPALSGLGAPHWRPEARGIITGISRGTTRGHIARAVLEGIALQNCDLLSAMEADSGLRLAALRVDGGAAQNDLLMQLQADFLGVELIRPKMLETTALGAALLAGLGIGLWRSEGEMLSAWEEDRRFHPTLAADKVQAKKERWADAVKRA